MRYLHPVLILAVASACRTAQADHLHRTPAPIVVESPQYVEFIDPNGFPLPTYQHHGRTYVHGRLGERYSLRISNPRSHRVEAVVSVDGLDVVDGEPADYIHKRGYLVPANGSITIDGFRTSTVDVAAFRFSSVSDSYAGRKGNDRNVGVVGVAFFVERKRRPWPPRPLPLPPNPIEEEASGRLGANDDARASKAPPKAAATAPSTRDSQQHRREGLGTTFGEQRESRVSFTRFVRANPKTPFHIAQVRYNDAAGLIALGIVLHPHSPELATREAADPFPGIRHFAKPPPPR